MHNKKQLFSTGRRKTSVAKVILDKNGSGRIKVNNMNFIDYFSRPIHRIIITQPLINNIDKNYDINCYTLGGGKTGQASAISHGISKLVQKLNCNHYSILKKNKFLTRDSRIVERKKYGQAKARKKFQFSKR